MQMCGIVSIHNCVNKVQVATGVAAAVVGVTVNGSGGVGCIINFQFNSRIPSDIYRFTECYVN